MGRKQQKNDTNITRSVEDEEERQLRINRNLARFLAEQTSQPRIAQKRQSQKQSLHELIKIVIGRKIISLIYIYIQFPSKKRYPYISIFKSFELTSLYLWSFLRVWKT